MTGLTMSFKVKDDGSKTNRITAKEAGDDNTIYTYDFAFKDFALPVGGDTKAQDFFNRYSTRCGAESSLERKGNDSRMGEC